MTTPRTALAATAIAALAAAALAGSAAAAPVAPPTAFETTPPSLNFGTVMVDSGSTKPVTMINRTKETLYYNGASWPNFQNPSGWSEPYGFWNVSGSGEFFPCYEIAPRSTCTLNFQFMPKAPGTFTSYFEAHYKTAGGQDHMDTTLMRAVGRAPAS